MAEVRVLGMRHVIAARRLGVDEVTEHSVELMLPANAAGIVGKKAHEGLAQILQAFFTNCHHFMGNATGDSMAIGVDSKCKK